MYTFGQKSGTSGQKSLSVLLHQKVLDDLKQSFSASPRDFNRLNGVSMPHATAFLHAPPNEQAGTRLAPQACCFAVRWLLGLSVVMEPLYACVFGKGTHV